MENKKIKVLFLGTPPIARSALESLINDDQIEVVAVVTNEDKPIGRSHSKLQETPVSELSQLHNIRVIKTNKINNIFDIIKNIGEYDYILTCAFGQLISDEILALPKKLSLNIHASLLPEGRGGAPIHWSIINGKKETGISVMEMVSEFDAGDFWIQEKIEIEDKDTYDSLYEKLSKMIKTKTSDWLKRVDEGNLPRITQNSEKVSKWLNIRKDDAKIDFNDYSLNIYNKIRGLNSKPGAWIEFREEKLKIWSSIITNETSCDLPGTIIDIDENGIKIATFDFNIIINEITIPGKKKMKSTDFHHILNKQ